MKSLDDPYRLGRFIAAQDPLYAQVCAELQEGCKSSHWMWFVFPQIAGLGQSALAREFAIGSLAEANAYLQHPILGSRLLQCTGLVNAVRGRTLLQIFGHPDNLKFQSSMTLFARAEPHDAAFGDALARYCGGEPDVQTLQRISHCRRT